MKATDVMLTPPSRDAASPSSSWRAVPEEVIALGPASLGPGHPLDTATRERMESRLGHDFSGVRLHTDPVAARSAAMLGAAAYTAGQHVVFGKAEHDSGSREGQTLLAHELVHTVQQHGGAATGALPVGGEADPLERQADAVAEAAMSGTAKPPARITQTGAVGIRRKPNKYARLGIDELRRLAKSDPEAIEALRLRFRSMSSKTLAEHALTDPLAASVYEARNVGVGAALHNPVENELPAPGAKPAAAPARTPSYGEAQEGPLRDRHHPKASLLSGKAAGFDLAEGYKTVFTDAETVKGVVQVDQRIAGGNWVQIKVLQGTGEEHVVDNIKRAMERADNALKSVPGAQMAETGKSARRRVLEQPSEELVAGRANQFERMGEGHRYRTTYARRPDRITIHLHFDNVPETDAAALARLRARGELAVAESVYRDALPPVQVRVTGRPVAKAAAGPASELALRQVGAGAAHAVERRVAADIGEQIVKRGRKDVAEVATETVAGSLKGKAERRLAAAAVPAIGIPFSLPDFYKGGQDILHGNIVMGVGTIGVATVDVAADFLHLTDAVTAGGGTALSLTIQAWTTAMQMGFESARADTRSRELNDYIRQHGGALPSDKELMGYYGFNDEGILLLKNDIAKAARGPKVTAAMVRDEAARLIKELDANIDKQSLAGNDLLQLQAEREVLQRIHASFAKRAADEARKAELERAKDKDRENRRLAARVKQDAARASAPSPPQTTPAPAGPLAFATPQPQAAPLPGDPFGLLGRREMSPVERAAGVAEILSQQKNAFLRRIGTIGKCGYPTGALNAYLKDLRAWLNNFDAIIGYWKKSGSTGWEGVQRMLALRDQVGGELRVQLMVDQL